MAVGHLRDGLHTAPRFGRGYSLFSPPARVVATDLLDLLNLHDGMAKEDLRDPRDHRVLLQAERFPHLISLKELSGKDVRNPQKEVENIRSGKKTNKDYGGYEAGRAATLTWIKATIKFPTIIAVRSVVPGIHPGAELYFKEFDYFGRKIALLVCRRVGPKLLVPVTWYPRDKGPKEHEIIYHALPVRI